MCLVYITSLLILRRDNILLADFRNLTICIINLYILQGMFLVFNLGIDSTKYLLLSGYVMQLLKINLSSWFDVIECYVDHDNSRSLFIHDVA